METRSSSKRQGAPARYSFPTPQSSARRKPGMGKTLTRIVASGEPALRALTITRLFRFVYHASITASQHPPSCSGALLIRFDPTTKHNTVAPRCGNDTLFSVTIRLYDLNEEFGSGLMQTTSPALLFIADLLSFRCSRVRASLHYQTFRHRFFAGYT